MKSVKRKLRDEINKTSFDERILAEIKNRAGVPAVTARERSVPPKRGKWRLATLAASLCCVFALTLLLFAPSGDTGGDNVTYLTINLTPNNAYAANESTAVEFTLDENNNVSSQRALSESGAVVLMGNDYRKVPVADACKEIILLSGRLNLLGRSPVDIMIFDDDPAKETSLCEEVEEHFGAPAGYCSLSINDFGSQTSLNAQQYGVNKSKMYLMETASAVSDTPFNETINLSTPRLIELAYGYDENAMDSFENRLSDRFKTGEDNFDDNMYQLSEIRDKIYDLQGNPQNCDKIKNEINAFIREEDGTFFGDNVIGGIDGMDDLDTALNSGRGDFISEIEKALADKEYWLEMLFYNIKLSVIDYIFG